VRRRETNGTFLLMHPFQEDSKVLRDRIGAHVIDYIREKPSRIGKSTDEGGMTKTIDQITSLFKIRSMRMVLSQIIGI